MDDVLEIAIALGAAQKRAGGPRNPAKVPEVSRIVHGLEMGSEIVSAVYSGYVRGWDGD